MKSTSTTAFIHFRAQ